jgi:DNA-directed RNA polymerase subunit RPC12/RpoP
MTNERRRTNRTPVAPIQTRDPQPGTRDPAPAARPESEEVPQIERQHPVIIRVPLARCPKCGHTVFRNGGNSKPNISTLEMLRYRKCANCGKAVRLAVPMTEKQVSDYVENDKCD